MPAIEVDRVSGQKTPHDCCDRDRSGTKKKMKMVWDKCPGITNGLSVGKDISEAG